MSEIKVDKISPRLGTDITLGDSGDTFTIPSGVTITNNGTQIGFGSANIEDNGTATAITIDSSNNVEVSNDLKFNSGYGSVATAYGVRAWVNFNGVGTPAIRDSGNVSSITDHNVGDYTVNFSTSMSDANYSALITANDDTTTAGNTGGYAYGSLVARITNSYSTSSIRFNLGYPANTSNYDQKFINVAIIR